MGLPGYVVSGYIRIIYSLYKVMGLGVPCWAPSQEPLIPYSQQYFVFPETILNPEPKS